MTFRFHILGIPHTVTHKDYVACAYTQKVLKFARMMKNLGHHVIHYGNEDSVLDCTEHVSVTTKKDLEFSYGSYDWRTNFFKYDHQKDPIYKTFTDNAIKEITKRIQPYDFILAFFGLGHEKICNHFDKRYYIIVEPGIGYEATFAPCRIFESYAWYHAITGPTKLNPNNKIGITLPSWFDAIIPNYFDTDDFDYKESKEDYFLYLGRVLIGKGVDIAIDITEKIGEKLIIAGQMSDDIKMFIPEFPNHVKFVGYADAEMRRNLMSNAKAGIIASRYIEPFGGAQIEFLMSGTPTITTDWGAFTENNIHGITGYRCRTFEQFVWAAKNISNINPKNCREWAENFTLEKIGPMYEEYFTGVYNFYKHKDWYKSDFQRESFCWLNKNYPNNG